MRNREVADLLTRMGTLLEIKGEIVFKIRAYYRAAESLQNLGEDIAVLKDEGRLAELQGVGKTLADKICEYLDTGKIQAYEDLIQVVPETLLDIIRIPSLGPKKAKLFFDELKVKDLDSLEAAIEDGRLLALPKIQQKTVDNIRRGIAIVRKGRERMTIAAAHEAAAQIVMLLKDRPEIKRVAVAGSLRRAKETVRDIDILCVSDDPEATMAAFVQLPITDSVSAHGSMKSSILIERDIQIDLRVVEDKHFGAALLYFTGSKQFNIRLRQIAIKKGMKINEYGVFTVASETETCLASDTEKACLHALDLPDIPPELREDIGDQELFGGQPLPELIQLKDIRGDLHVHSTWSDGRHTIPEMVAAARAKGYSYLAICDHSQGLKIARGMSPADLKKKKKEIDALNAELKDFRILFGTEVDIDSDGNLDYNDTILSMFDIVVASIHAGFEQSSAQLTKRLVKACGHKSVNIIAHPTGVHIGKREPYDIDFQAVCRAAVDHNVCLEINAFPIRLDLNSANVYFARRQGVRFTIDTDAHHTRHLEYMPYGVGIARRGWLTKNDVLNTRSADALLSALKK